MARVVRRCGFTTKGATRLRIFVAVSLTADRQSQPLVSLEIIAGDAQTERVHVSQRALSRGMAAFRRVPIPL